MTKWTLIQVCGRGRREGKVKIIIVGAGKVGETLAADLSREGNDITVIDKVDSVVDHVCDRYDIMGFAGNGASYSVLMDADIENADLMIAVTGEDELNLLCCLIARKAGHCQTIARVRNPEYNREVSFIKEELGLALIINQEFTSAQEIARLLRFPTAIEIDTFAKGRVELLHFRIPKNSILEGLRLMEMHDRLDCNVLVCTLERENMMIIPQGDTILRGGDVISIVAPVEEQVKFFGAIGLKTNAVRNVMIIGGGEIAYYLAKLLLHSGIQVKIVEKELGRCEELAELLPHATIIHGDGSDRSILEEEGIRTVEGFVSLTGIDEENIGAMKNSYGSNVETLHRMLDDQAEALEFLIRDNFAHAEIPLKDLALKQGVLVACINRKGKIILPRGNDVIRPGDTVVIITSLKGLNDISDIFQK